MADLSGVALDPNAQASTGFTVITPGDYKAVILQDKLVDTKSGKALRVRVQITEGEYAGQTVDDWINIINASATCQAIGQGQLRGICEICGIEYPLQGDTNRMYGKPMVVSIINDEFKSNTSGEMLKNNKIRAYKPVPTVTTQAVSDTPAQAVGDDW